MGGLTLLLHAFPFVFLVCVCVCVCVRPLVVRLLRQARPATPDILTFYSVVGSIQKSKGNTNDAFIICVIMKRFVVLDLVVVVTWILPRQRQNNVTGKETMTTTTMEGGT